MMKSLKDFKEKIINIKKMEMKMKIRLKRLKRPIKKLSTHFQRNEARLMMLRHNKKMSKLD